MVATTSLYWHYYSALAVANLIWQPPDYTYIVGGSVNHIVCGHLVAGHSQPPYIE